jgi:hypothetical protein
MRFSGFIQNEPVAKQQRAPVDRYLHFNVTLAC